MYEISDKRSAIRELQSFLLELHFEDPELPFLTLDGIYDVLTRESVCIFQKKHELPVTGTADYPTWQAIFSEYRAAHLCRTAGKEIPPDTLFPVGIGARGTGVRTLQRLLNALAERYGIGIRTDVNGICSFSTVSLIRKIQEKYGVPQTGAVDSLLFDKMLRDYGYPFPERKND